MSRLSVLMTVYNEVEFIEYAIRSILPHVDDLVIVEGAYQETIACGAEPRSTDGTIDKINDILDIEYCKTNLFQSLEPEVLQAYCDKMHYIEANEQTDKDQRNIGLEKIKELNSDGWVWIVDGDEVYDPNVIAQVKVAINQMEKQQVMAAYFKSLTFVNDLRHYVEQSFPRLFRITPECKFVNDNFMEWPEKNMTWFTGRIIRIPYIRYHHYAFCKGQKRFDLKKKWWETRFGKDFDYGWKINNVGQIEDPTNVDHVVREYTGEHPAIMQDHPKWKAVYA